MRYEALYQSSYWADVVAVHEAMGLAVRLKDAVAMAYLTPTKEKEVVVVSRTAGREFGMRVDCVWTQISALAGVPLFLWRLRCAVWGK